MRAGHFSDESATRGITTPEVSVRTSFQLLRATGGSETDLAFRRDQSPSPIASARDLKADDFR